MAIDMKAMANYVFEIDRLGSVFRKAMQYSSDIYKNASSREFLNWPVDYRNPEVKRRFLKHITKALIQMDRYQIAAAQDFKIGKTSAEINYETEKTFNKVVVAAEFYGTRTE